MEGDSLSRSASSSISSLKVISSMNKQIPQLGLLSNILSTCSDVVLGVNVFFDLSNYRE